jgi:hypothetical protein
LANIAIISVHQKLLFRYVSVFKVRGFPGIKKNILGVPPRKKGLRKTGSDVRD